MGNVHLSFIVLIADHYFNSVLFIFMSSSILFYQVLSFSIADLRNMTEMLYPEEVELLATKKARQSIGGPAVSGQEFEDIPKHPLHREDELYGAKNAQEQVVMLAKRKSQQQQQQQRQSSTQPAKEPGGKSNKKSKTSASQPAATSSHFATGKENNGRSPVGLGGTGTASSGSSSSKVAPA
jgi:hypothetical protein